MAMSPNQSIWDGPALRAYREDALTSPKLAAAEIATLIPLAQSGDVQARDRLVAHFQRLAFATALHYARRTQLPVLDLVQECNIGLLHALRKYAPDHDAAFSTYAVRWMMHYCLRWLAGQDLIVIPPRQVERRRRIQAIEDRQSRLGIVTSDADLCVLARVTPSQLREIRSLPQTSETLPTSDEQAGLEYAAAPAVPLSEPSLPDYLAAALATLAPLERDIILARADGQTHQLIADTIGKSRERIRQLDHLARAKLRAALKLDRAA